MSLNKTQQKTLTNWLKQQGVFEKRLLNLSILLGAISSIILIFQAWLLATILQSVIINNQSKYSLITYFSLFMASLIIRAILAYMREKISFIYGKRIRKTIRHKVLDRLETLGPVYIKSKPAGSWATIIIEQVENMQDFYARYLPQMKLSVLVPFFILLALFPINWAAALILLITSPLIPIFMILVGLSAAEKNRQNFVALSRLSGHFLDRLKGLTTIRLFYQGEKEQQTIIDASENFRVRTMDVLKQAFLSSAVLEFFSSLAIALVAVYYGFSYLGQFHFGGYGFSITLFSGFMVLLLAPEYYQPLRDLGTYYHAKAQALGAAEALHTFLTETEESLQPLDTPQHTVPFTANHIDINAKDLVVLSLDRQPLTPPLTFSVKNKQKVAIIGKSGTGKTSLIQALLGFLPYEGSLTINGVELNQLDKPQFRQNISWVGQNPYLPARTVKQNILLANPSADESTLQYVMKQAFVDEFIPLLPQGLETEIGDDAIQLSIGQTQRIAVARALLRPALLLLLDEPTASLDMVSANYVRTTLKKAATHQTTLLVTHKLYADDDFDQIIEIFTREH